MIWGIVKIDQLTDAATLDEALTII